jgi:phage shock protein E
MFRRLSRYVVAAALLGGAVNLSACSSNDSQAVINVTESIIIDVRSAEEFATGHLEGALNLNVEDGTLQSTLASLDPSDSYIVYCRSGRRSAIAVEQMAAAGFANVTDLGSVEDASRATSIAIIN